ncbi:MAG TPA: biotin/lipoate A/B protein ligase family protein [Gemmatales bacterium]|nr:biotin/lipoate A/B protein ligase family protein [Gemmatales bacterium]
MHGECKTPGGKLIAVDLMVVDGLIQSARLSGDFFIHPETHAASVFQQLTQTIQGQSVALSLGEWKTRLHAALPWDVELLGSSTDALAVALCRARGDAVELESATTSHEIPLSTHELAARLIPWTQCTWHLLPEVALAPAMNVALDEVLCQQVAQGRRPATLRFWRWTEQAVILGRCQSVLNEVDTQAAEKLGIRIVRRMTGGGAMFLQPHGAITYSLYLPEKLLAGIPLRQSYQVCESWVIDGLRSLGVDAFHAPLNDIACSMGKIGGAAQARRNGVVLHHTTMAYDMDPGEMVRVLRIGREKLSDKPAIASAAKRVSPIVRQTGLAREEVVARLFASFQQRFGGEVSSLRNEEMQEAEQLVASKYGNEAWTGEIR